jgi:hypothetical protein
MHPGNIRILPDNKIGLIDFGIKADPYRPSLIKPFVNKLRSDTLFMKRDFDLVRILNAHFQLYMTTLYASIESLFLYTNRDIKDFFREMVSFLNISTSDADETKVKLWLIKGPAYMFGDLMHGARTAGVEVYVKDQTAQRGLTTLYSMLGAVGLQYDNSIALTVYPSLCDRIEKERPELFKNQKILALDLALENLYIGSKSSKTVTLNYHLISAL